MSLSLTQKLLTSYLPNFFSAFALPSRITFTDVLTVKSPDIWKIQTSLSAPEIVILIGIETALVYLYNPGVGVGPLLLPVPSSVNSGKG